MKIVTIGTYANDYGFVLNEKDAATFMALLANSTPFKISYKSDSRFLLPSNDNVSISVRDMSIEREILTVQRLFPDVNIDDLIEPMLKKHASTLNIEVNTDEQ